MAVHHLGEAEPLHWCLTVKEAPGVTAPESGALLLPGCQGKMARLGCSAGMKNAVRCVVFLLVVVMAIWDDVVLLNHYCYLGLAAASSPIKLQNTCCVSSLMQKHNIAVD